MPAERVPLDVHLAPLRPEQRGLWDRYAELVAAAGPSEMVVTKSRVAFRAAYRIFTGAFFLRGRLELFFDLPEPVPEEERDARFRQVWEHAPRLWVHRLTIGRLNELDHRLGAWLKLSRAAYSLPASER